MHLIAQYPRLLQLALLIAPLCVFALGRRLGLSLRWAFLPCSVALAAIGTLGGVAEGYRAGSKLYKYNLLEWRRWTLPFLAAIGLLFTHAGMLSLFAVILAIHLALDALAHRLSMAQACALAAVVAVPASLRFVSTSQVAGS